jgi:hypothetical protein
MDAGTSESGTASEGIVEPERLAEGAGGADDDEAGGADANGTRGAESANVGGGGGQNPPENAVEPRCRGRDEEDGAIWLVAEVAASSAARDGGT